jgi:hypothetical protein
MSDGKHFEKGMCLHCGGAVGDDGMALAGELETGEHRLPEEVSDESTQQLETERLREFAKALGGGH